MQLIIRNKRIAFLMLSALLVLNIQGQVQELYLKGIAYSNHNDFEKAGEYLEMALSHDKDNADCLLELAKINRHSGNNSSALEYLNRVEKQAPGKGSYLQARIYASEGNAGAAVKFLEIHLRSPYKLPSNIILLEEDFSVIENSPEWRNLWKQAWYSEEEEFLQEIRYLNSSGEYLLALEMVDTRLGEANEWDALYAARGDILLNMKQFQGAVLAYTRAIEINSVQADYYSGRGKAFLAEEKPERAIADLEKVLRMKPENLDLLIEIGKIYHQSENYTKAAYCLQKSLEYYPENLESMYHLGEVHYDTKKYLDALVQFNACLKLSTADPRFFAARGKTYLETKTYAYALNDLGMALDLDPGDHEVWFMKGLTRWYLNDREGSLSDWKQAARLGSYKAALKLEELGQPL